ncbi:hypothetical protein [Burkholderia vietnamiensis]|uniref:hypothetical protein n=1 Tax=Burkholderia vietnamiensis TaxID=60552 RepID=UPI001CC7919E|nr:hypothetical protein [Burkholderia vietnamiensis]HDR9086356.1 hypothetical protein [Burkholderia vietnamiensis]
MTYREVMALPIRAFWTLNRNINRLLAEEDLRAFVLHVSRQSVEAAGEYETKLRSEMFPGKGDAVNPRLNEKRDEAGFSELKLMAAQRW